MNFAEELRQQRWDDHRFYHHNRINQSLHFVSALCFLASYVLIFSHPALAVFVGWMLAMVLRQVGHFFFEPWTYDAVNGVSHDYKENVKVGYNLRRKVVLLLVWAAVSVLVGVDPTLSGLLAAPQGKWGLLDNLTQAWLVVGLGAVVVRTVHLFFLMGVQSGLVWATKIFTDPLHDAWIYHKAPLLALSGDMHDDMAEWYDQRMVGRRA